LPGGGVEPFAYNHTASGASGGGVGIAVGKLVAEAGAAASSAASLIDQVVAQRENTATTSAASRVSYEWNIGSFSWAWFGNEFVLVFVPAIGMEDDAFNDVRALAEFAGAFVEVLAAGTAAIEHFGGGNVVGGAAEVPGRVSVKVRKRG